MNIADLIQSYFDGDNAQRLGQAVGIDGNLAQKALSIGLPMQVNALADHAAVDEPELQRDAQRDDDGRHDQAGHRHVEQGRAALEPLAGGQAGQQREQHRRGETEAYGIEAHRRAGADAILTYFARQAAAYLR